MKKFIISGAVSVLSLGLFTPHSVLAEDVPPQTVQQPAEDTPPDAPYQEATEDVAVVAPQAPLADVTPEEPSAMLPTVHNSPLTPADPTLNPITSEISTVSAESVRLSVNLIASLTLRSMLRSRIWSR